MATIITGDTGQETYHRVIQRILSQGTPRTPRGVTTLDLGCTVIELVSPFSALPLNCGRNLSKNIAVAEAVQLIGGFSSPGLTVKASPAFTQYMDNGRFHGAYGARMNTQMLAVSSKLRDDPNTRRAIITLWDTWLDNQEGKHDYPCTVMMQFEFNALHTLDMNVVMRSNDAWLGLPYDMFQFAQLQLSLCRALNVMPGYYRHIALSLHLYETNLTDAALIHAPTLSTEVMPTGIGRHTDTFTDIMRRARRLSSNQSIEHETESERWYRERFATFL